MIRYKGEKCTEILHRVTYRARAVTIQHVSVSARGLGKTKKNISKTDRDKGLVPNHHQNQQENAYGE